MGERTTKITRLLALALGMASLSAARAAPAQTLPPAMPAEVAARSPESVAATAPEPRVPPTASAEGPAPAPPPAVSAPESSAIRHFRGYAEDDLLREMATRPVLRVIERFNSSTLVFHCDLGDGIEVAFKPARQNEHDWWIHEVAGYELARVLGIDGRVPPAVARRVPVGALDGFLREANLEVNRDGTVDGAAIFWMPVLRRTNLHTAEARDQWTPWLDPRRELPAAHRTRATQIAALLAFDYLQANFDRWNSANVPQDEHGDLVFRDNNRGWYIENLTRLDRGGIDHLQRIPASLLTTIGEASGEALARRTERASPRILNTLQVQHFERRRRYLLAKIDELVAEHGRDRVVIDDAAAPIALRVPEVTDSAGGEAPHERRARRHRRRREAAVPPAPAAPVARRARRHRRRDHGAAPAAPAAPRARRHHRRTTPAAHADAPHGEGDQRPHRSHRRRRN
jgi:hypothetical protein